jgi:hypothetical protein
MASSGKRKTTMAKLNRESKLRDKRAVKAARKDARKQGEDDGIDPADPLDEGNVRVLTPEEAAQAAG